MGLQLLASLVCAEPLHRVGQGIGGPMTDRLRSDKANFQAVIQKVGIKAE